MVKLLTMATATIAVSLVWIHPVRGEPAATTAASGATTDAAGAPEGLEEIVVTAQRRSENLERTPVAVSVLGADALARQAISTEEDLHDAVSGLTIRSSVNSNNFVYSLRGQTVDAFSSSRPAVLPYVNEVQIGGYGGSSAFYDLQSIQVLKGPQGTLFGRNATGGAVLFTTTKPDDAFDGYFSASTGNYGLAKFEGAVNIPIVPGTVLARVAAYYESHDGYQYDTFTGGRVGDVDRIGVRGSLTVNFTDKIKNTLVVDDLSSGGSSTGLVLRNVLPQFSNAAPIPANLLFTPFLDTAIGFPGAFAAFTAGNPKIPPGGIYAFLAIQNARGPFVISDNNGSEHDANNLLVSNITTVDLADGLQFKNVFGFNNIRSEDGEDADGSPYGVDGIPTGVPYGLENLTREFSEEPQLLGKALDGNLSYVTGLYYSDDKTKTYELSSFVDLEPLAPPTNAYNNTLLHDRSYAGYGQGTYDLSQTSGVQGLGVTLGVRYTNEKVTLDQLPGSAYFDPKPPLENELSKTFDNVSWQLGVQEQLNQDLLLYVVSRHSFRSGGFNTSTPPAAGFASQGGAAFNTETATDVELGVKYQGLLGQLPARANLAAYTETIDNVQRVTYTEINDSLVALTANVPQARVMGLEGEAQINPMSWLKLGVNLAYADARFTKSIVTIAVTTPPATINFGPYPDTPTWSGSVFAEASTHVTGDLLASVRGDVYDQTRSYFSSTEGTITPGTALPAYAVTNFQAALDDTKAGWTVSLNVKNAFNRVYYVGGLPTANLFTSNAVIPAAPRTYMVTLRYKF